ncbi:S1C family serine protease [Raineyella sp.]|uniref:S1C family serine protease n=1 Tax=Raineyella sp. TaxID=1911550 RepID=UPI002B2033A7|nr:trypsin-like peptidase domain-containing protein [Raineyella sp.]MEA5154775.1 trypsin-like peptidase domain-containing protein [Raineyella sp.]
MTPSEAGGGVPPLEPATDPARDPRHADISAVTAGDATRGDGVHGGETHGGGRGGTRAGTLVLAAVIAVAVGGPAGYAGARLGAAPTPVASASAPATAAPTGRVSALPGVPGPSTGTTSDRALVQDTSPGPTTLDVAAIAPAALRATVAIRATGSGGEGSGSGIVLPGGRVVTNNHVIATADPGGRIEVTIGDGRRTTATLLGASRAYDLAVLGVDLSGFGDAVAPARLGTSAGLGVGRPVVTVGAPYGLQGTITAGIVSALDRPMQVTGHSDTANAPTAYINAIQTDAPINPGNSGGPLYDAGGRVVGINSAILTAAGAPARSGSVGLGFAIPLDEALPIIEALTTEGKVSYPVFGAAAEATADGVGVRLSAVDTGGPAAAAGLRAGDVVTRLGGVRVEDGTGLIVQVRRHRPGEELAVEYLRDGSVRQALVTLSGKVG